MELSEFGKHFITVLSKWNELFNPAQVPPFLFHYTTFEGLKGILKDNALRATFSQSLNDGSEWEFGRSVVRKYPVPEEMAKALAPPSPWAEPAPKSIFVTCFCEESDLLSMWRSYSVHGGGYCLGFDGPHLANLQRERLEKLGEFAARLVKVYYGESLPPLVEGLLKSGAHSTAEWVLENIIKHHGFVEEKEWRIIVPDPPVSLMSFHAGQVNIKASVLVRNHDGDHRLPLKKLFYGPTLRDDAALETTLRWLLESYGYGDVEVVRSVIPYRL